MSDSYEEDGEIVEYDEEALPLPITENAHATSSLGMTIIVDGRTAWPKFEFGDTALPGESAADLQARVLEITLDGAFTVAENSKYVMQQLSIKKNQQ